jgi:hypothetical protein
VKRSGPLRRKTPLVSRTSLRRVALKRGRSSGRARPDEQLATWCEAATSACAGRAEHRHHKRGRVGVGCDDRDATLDVCVACHQFIHGNPAESYERGWLIRRT